MVTYYVSGSLTSFTSTIKVQPLAFPISRVQFDHASPCPLTITDLYIHHLFLLHPGSPPPCSEPLTTHLRLLRTTTSLGSLRPFLFNVHSFHFTTLPLTTHPLNPYGYRELFPFLSEDCLLSHTGP